MVISMRKIWNSEKLYDVKFSFDEKCRNIFNITKEYFKTRKKNPIMFVGGGLLLLILIVGISFSYANLTPVASVEIYSENADFENGDMGAWKVTKSAEWVDEDIANIKFQIESIIGLGKSASDFIFVVEDSSKTGMLNEEQRNVVFSIFEYFYLITTPGLFDDSSKISLITFNSTYNIIGDFTRDIDVLLNNALNSITFQGNTNYYQALSGVDEVLSDYQKEENKDCTVVFITFGEPNEQKSEERNYMEQLRSKYPYLKLNSIGMFFSESESTQSLTKISDNVYIEKEVSDSIELSFISALDVTRYNSFKIEDTINSEYFEVLEATSDIGKVTINRDLDNTKVNWDLGENYFSGTEEQLDIKIKLKKEHTEELGTFQTNIQEIITSQIGMLPETVTSSLTPVINNSYLVTYDGNAPDDCTVQNLPESKLHKNFSTVEIEEEPTCSGYQFKGWNIIEDGVEKIGDEYFIMPKHDVTIKGEWSKITIKKSMSGKISPAGSLYNIMASNSVPDNRKSQFVTSATGIDFTKGSSDTNGKGIYQMASTANDEYPIYYYRGAVENNNIKFANFCWKIVRTTDTGGVKLIYNGLPDNNGTCTIETGIETTIGTSNYFNNPRNSLADVGYMYGTRYESNKINMSPSFWYNWDSDVKQIIFNDLYQMNYYSNNVNYEYDELTGKYIYNLVEPFQFQYLPSVNKDEKYRIEGKYTCGIGKTTCESVYYIQALSTNPSSYDNYIYLLNDGKTYDNIVNTNWVYGNDVEYKDNKTR